MNLEPLTYLHICRKHRRMMLGLRPSSVFGEALSVHRKLRQSIITTLWEPKKDKSNSSHGMLNLVSLLDLAQSSIRWELALILRLVVDHVR